MDKNDFFRKWSQITCFILKCCYFRRYRQKTIFKSTEINPIFSKWSQNNDIFLEILTFNYGQKLFFWKWSQITCFILKCWYFRRYGQKTIFKSTEINPIFSKLSQNNDLFLEMLIFLDTFFLEVFIFADLWAKTILLKMISNNVVCPEIFLPKHPLYCEPI